MINQRIHPRRLLFVMAILSVFFISPTVKAVISNESIQAWESLAQAERDISEMADKNISIIRVNETYQEALQMYAAQKSLEEQGRKAKFDLVIEYATGISEIKKTAFEVKDELVIFVETFGEASKESDLSEMQEEYDYIISSFEEERFEDVRGLIDDGYERISEIQSSQTAVNAVYQATSRTLKNFFKNYGLTLVISLIVLLILFIIFRKSIEAILRRRKLNHLILQKKAINQLLRKIQHTYFRNKRISKSEYETKVTRFKELIRDIDRQVMVIKEEIFKVNRRKSLRKNKKV